MTTETICPKPKRKTYPAHGSGFLVYYDQREADAYMDKLEADVKAVRRLVNLGGAAMVLDGKPVICGYDPKDAHPIHGSCTQVEGVYICDVHEIQRLVSTLSSEREAHATTQAALTEVQGFARRWHGVLEVMLMQMDLPLGLGAEEAVNAFLAKRVVEREAHAREMQRYRMAIRWALGYRDEGVPAFEPRKNGDPPYWWRNKLAKLAFPESESTQ